MDGSSLARVRGRPALPYPPGRVRKTTPADVVPQGSPGACFPPMLKDFANLATWDRALRIVLGLVMLYLGWSDLVDGVWAIALVVFAWVPLLTGAIGWCPTYSILGISTLRRPGSSKVR